MIDCNFPYLNYKDAMCIFYVYRLQSAFFNGRLYSPLRFRIFKEFSEVHQLFVLCSQEILINVICQYKGHVKGFYNNIKC